MKEILLRSFKDYTLMFWVQTFQVLYYIQIPIYNYRTKPQKKILMKVCWICFFLIIVLLYKILLYFIYTNKHNFIFQCAFTCYFSKAPQVVWVIKNSYTLTICCSYAPVDNFIIITCIHFFLFIHFFIIFIFIFIFII